MNNEIKFIVFVSLMTQGVVLFLSTTTQFFADFYLEMMILLGVFVIPILSTIIALFIASLTALIWKVQGYAYAASVVLAPVLGFIIFIVLVMLIQKDHFVENWMYHIG